MRVERWKIQLETHLRVLALDTAIPLNERRSDAPQQSLRRVDGRLFAWDGEINRPLTQAG